jgi:HSP20 family protein
VTIVFLNKKVDQFGYKEKKMSLFVKGYYNPSATKVVTSAPQKRDEFLTSVDTLMDEFFNNNYSGFAKEFSKSIEVKGSYPKVNFIDNGDHYILEAAIPGYKKDDVTIEIKEGILTIRGRASTESDPGGKGVYIWREIKRSKFLRSFALPENLEHSNTSASIDSGILMIKIPVKAPIPKKPASFEVKIK